MPFVMRDLFSQRHLLSDVLQLTWLIIYINYKQKFKLKYTRKKRGLTGFISNLVTYAYENCHKFGGNSLKIV